MRLIPLLLLTFFLAACGSEPDLLPGQNLPPQGALHALAGLETATGSFEGRSGHETAGTVSVFRSDGRWYVSLGRDFRFDGAPDPKVAFGEGGYIAEATLGDLKEDEGASVYEVLAPIDVGDYTEIWLWCEEFAVPLGYAKLSLL